MKLIHDLIVQQLPMYTDKQLHFLVFGFIGLFIFCILTKYLQAEDRDIFLYSFSGSLLLSSLIEIIQQLTKTGTPDINDIIAGCLGTYSFIFCWILIKNISDLLYFLFVRK